MYLEKCGADTRNRLGKVLNGQIRGVAFDLMREIEEQQKEGGADNEALAFSQDRQIQIKDNR
jgi:hypothetical protein